VREFQCQHATRFITVRPLARLVQTLHDYNSPFNFSLPTDITTGGQYQTKCGNPTFYIYTYQ